jgi:hypothetical protein
MSDSTFSYSKATAIVDPLGAIQYLAWDCLRLVDDVRVASIYSASPPVFDWKNPLERDLEDEMSAERPLAQERLPKKIESLRKRLHTLKELAARALNEEAFP